jgi:hypothetical protein
MESRMVKRIEELYRQDAKFTERKEERSRERNCRETLGSLCGLSAILASWRSILFDWERTGSPPWNPS